MRITPGTMTVVILAILAGLVGVYVIRMALPKPVAQVAAVPQLTNVPLASQDLPVDRVLTMGDISLMPMSAEKMRDELPLEVTMLSPDQIIGRRLREPIKQGQPFKTTGMYPQGTGPAEMSVFEQLEPGYRAVTLPLPVEQTAAIKEGALVDVLFRVNPKEGDEVPEMTITLIEGCKVLKIDEPSVRAIRPPSSGGGVYYVPPPPFTATIGVKHEDARKLQVVQGKGDLTMVARSPSDVLPSRGDKLTLADVLGIEVPSEIPMFRTEIVYAGTDRSVNSFPLQQVPPAPAPAPKASSAVPVPPKPAP